MTAEWDRDEALLTVERLKKIHRSNDVFADAATLLRAADMEIARLQRSLKTADSWLERWAVHAGTCSDNKVCSCGLTRVRFEVAGANNKGK